MVQRCITPRSELIKRGGAGVLIEPSFHPVGQETKNLWAGLTTASTVPGSWPSLDRGTVHPLTPGWRGHTLGGNFSIVAGEPSFQPSILSGGVTGGSGRIKPTPPFDFLAYRIVGLPDGSLILLVPHFLRLASIQEAARQ